MNEDIMIRGIETITGEIRALKQKTLACAVEIGRRLHEAKALLQHGEWGTWLAEKAEFSQSTANNLMKLFEEYGSSRSALFDTESNSQALGNLSYTKALMLISLPAEEREEFAEEHDLEALTTRDMEKLVRERDGALKERADAQERANELQRRIENSEKIGADLKRELEEIRRRPIELAVQEVDPAQMEAAIDKAIKEADKKQAAKIKELEKGISEAEKKRAELLKSKELAEQEKTAAENSLKLEKEKTAVAERELDAAKKAAAMSDPITTEFKTLFAEVQRLLGRLAELAKNSGENAIKLNGALDAMLKAFAERNGTKAPSQNEIEKTTGGINT